MNKMFGESVFKTLGSDCDFKIELDETITTQEKSVIYIDDIVIPNIFRTVEPRNNKLYITVIVPPIMPTSNRVIELDTHYFNVFSFSEQLNTKSKLFTDYIGERRQDLIFDINTEYDILKTNHYREIDKNIQV